MNTVIFLSDTFADISATVAENFGGQGNDW